MLDCGPRYRGGERERERGRESESESEGESDSERERKRERKRESGDRNPVGPSFNLFLFFCLTFV